jgi:hypothetical protein
MNEMARELAHGINRRDVFAKLNDELIREARHFGCTPRRV